LLLYERKRYNNLIYAEIGIERRGKKLQESAANCWAPERKTGIFLQKRHGKKKNSTSFALFPFII